MTQSKNINVNFDRVPTTMQAWKVMNQGPIDSDPSPLQLVTTDVPTPHTGEILVRVLTCGVCRTDLHVTEGDLSEHKKHVLGMRSSVRFVLAAQKQAVSNLVKESGSLGSDIPVANVIFAVRVMKIFAQTQNILAGITMAAMLNTPQLMKLLPIKSLIHLNRRLLLLYCVQVSLATTLTSKQMFLLVEL